jgi:type II secretory pathway component PulF
MELADQIRKMYKEGQKQQIVDLIAGESPDVIEDLFGSGRYKISEEMAKDMPLLRRIADTVGADLKAVQQAAAGRAALSEVKQEKSLIRKLPWLSRASTSINEAVAALERKMKAETLEVLIRAAQSGRDFNRVLDALPTKERNAFLAQFKNAESWSRFSTQVANAARTYATTQTAEPTNALAAKMQ